MKYEQDGKPVVVQPMTDEEDFPKPEPIEDEDVIEGISSETWLQIEREGGDEKLRDLLHDYEKMIKKRKMVNNNVNNNKNEVIDENGDSTEAAEE